jgi:hypothetical protein
VIIFLVIAVDVFIVVVYCLRCLLLMLRVGNVCSRLSVYAYKLRIFDLLVIPTFNDP